MPRINAVVECPVYDSFRVAQICGMFDVTPAAKASRTWSVELPDLAEPWQIGLIVGPSGSGKSTIARQAFGSLYSAGEWPADKAVIDAFGDRASKEIAAALSAVGFSSPPSWIKPYSVLSNGEKFRCDLARALLASNDLIAFDEFTSVVDRTVAQIGSNAISKAIRRTPGKRFVAVSCHYDIVPWLEPDWVLDMATCELARGRLHRPPITVEVRRTDKNSWRAFSHHHYLSHDLHPTARCYLGIVQGEPAAFVATLPTMGVTGARRVHRLVVLPDYQGIGIGTRVLAAVADHESKTHRLTIRTSHTALIRALERSTQWKCISVSKGINTAHHGMLWQGRKIKSAEGRIAASFRWQRSTVSVVSGLGR